MRHTGIDVIGDVQWGTHFCQFYESAQDLVETLVPYFKEGLAANEFCMWVTSEPLGVRQAREALKEAVPDLEDYIRSGQIEIIDYKDWYVRSGRFSADEVLKGWVDKLTDALAKGFEGLRLTGNTFWLERADWEDFRRYEEAVNNVIGRHKMLAMCTYSLQRCGATEILDVVANHEFALIKRRGRWEIIQSTVQKHIEERLKKSELTHSTILQTAQSGFWLADMGGKLLEVNQAYCRMSGFSQEELLKMSVCDLEGSETPEDTLKHIQFVRRQGHHQFETLHRRKDGTAYDVEVRTSYLDIEGGRLVVFVWDISDRKKMERDLRESEERFRTMADGSPDIIWVTDTTGAVRFINRRFHEFFGITQKQVEKTNWQALIHPDDAEAFLGTLNRSIEERMPFTGGARVKRFDGQSRWLSSQAEPRFSPEGEFLGYVGRSLDITDRRLAEQVLEKERNFTAAVLDTAGALVIVLDKKGQITRFNRACETMTGYSEAEVLGRVFWEFLVPEADLPGVRQTWEALQAGDFPNRYENHWVAKDGSTRLVSWSNTAIVDPGGQVEFIIGTGIDITEAKKAEAGIKYQALLLGQVHDGIVGADPDTCITYWNKGAELIYGFTEAEALGRTTGELLRPAYAPGERKKILDDLAHHGMSEATIRTRHKNGTEVIAEVHSTRIADESGATLGYVVAYRDVTGRKKADEELHRTREHLENLLDYANAPIIVWDPSFKITRFNHAFERLTGLQAGAVIGRPLDILFPEASRDESLGHIKRTLAGERWEVVEIPILRTDGAVRTVLWNSANVYDQDETTITATIAQGQDITERKLAEEELRRHAGELEKARAQAENEKLRLEAVMEALPVGVAITDVRGGNIKANSTYDRIWAGPRPGVRSVSDYAAYKARWADTGQPLAPEDWASAQVVEKGMPVVGQMIEIERFDGSRAHVINSASPVRDAAGHVVGSAVAIQDITELRRSQDDLRHLNRTLTALSHSNQALMRARDEKEFLEEACQIIVRDCGHAMVWIGFAEKDPQKSVKPVAFAGFEDGYIETLNISWADTERGRGPTGTAIRTGKPCACNDMLTDPKFAPWREQAIARGYTSSLVLPLLSESTPMGAISIYFRQPGRVSEDEMDLLSELANDIAYGIASIRLREAHARAEQSLQQRSLELQKLTETLEQRVAERTADLATANELLKAEITQRHILTAAIGQVKEGMAITDAAGRIEYFNPAFKKTNGAGPARLLGKSYYNLLAGKGAEEGLDKQARKTVEGGEAWSSHLIRKQKGGQAGELEIRMTPIRDPSGKIINYLVTERDVTQEVRLQQQLRQAQKMEALGTLAGGIAHDFNNILNPIFINTELVLMDAPLDKAARRELEIVLKAAERGRDLVKQIITFSRQKEKEQTPLKVGPVIKEALKFLRSSLPATIDMRQGIEPESGFILADPSQIHQVVMNLCNNAAYAMQEKGGTLDVSLKETAVDKSMALLHPGLKPGPYLRLTVCDTGKGMTPEVMERAFDPFFTTKKHGEGSGMGLALVHGIVGDYGGAVTVYSEVDKGTTFNIFFPRVATAELPAEAEPQEPLRGTERILLVDDERTQAQSIRNMLKRLGYQVAVRTDAEQALAAFRKDPDRFNLVITDQIMPKLTGVQLATRLLELRPGLPVILCTGFSELVDSEGAHALGIRGFLMKPFSMREMASAIKKALS
ncbi:MAG: sensor histidine kinase response regulator [Candidatus Aminicenantes bacterium]|nr:sensor histidine kinase response regulator [Candidatus Aminicenantes bacterium]